MSNYNIPIKNLSVHFAKEQRVFQQLTNKNALLDALVSLYNNTSKCLHKQEDTTNKFIQLCNVFYYYFCIRINSQYYKHLDKPIYHEINKSKVSLKDFNLLYKDFVEGAFGKVTIVKSIHDSEHIYAMKTLNKSYLNQQIDRSSPMEERLILSNTNEEWLPFLYASFQDKKNLYLVMEYAHGGDLENLMERRSYQFNEDEAKFYCAELILAVERVHQLGYMHRDIKPANILIDSKGHIKLGDLGSCISTDTTEDLFMVGTMPYISPEMCNFESSAYGAEVDWWSVGIVLYELLFGQTPFTGRDIQIQMNLLNPNLSIHFNPDIHISDQVKDLLTKLLSKSKQDRLKDPSRIKAHPFFKDVDWDTLHTTAVPPFIPSIKSLDDISFFASTNNQDEEDEEEEDEEEDEDEDRDLPYIGYTYSCTALNNILTLQEKPDDNSDRAFLTQLRQKLTQPEPDKKIRQYDKELSTLKAQLTEKDQIIDTMKQKEQYTQTETERLQSLLVQRDTEIHTQSQSIQQLDTVINQEIPNYQQTITSLQRELEHKVPLLEKENKQLSTEIANLKQHHSTEIANLKQQQSTEISILEQQLLHQSTEISSSQQQQSTEISSLEQQLLHQSTEISNLKRQHSTEIASLEQQLLYQSKDHLSQFNNQATDYTMLINRAQSEINELKQELASLQNSTTTATRFIKRTNKSLPIIPTTNHTSSITQEHSPTQGRSLILSSMWQRDRGSLKTVQQALEASENKLAFTKRQVHRLKKEVKCFQKYTFEQGNSDPACVLNTCEPNSNVKRTLPFTPPLDATEFLAYTKQRYI